MDEPKSSITELKLALACETSDLMSVDQDTRKAMRLDLDREIEAFHAEDKDHPVQQIAKRFPLRAS